jgi:diguanylate cyclase (GGDEF)-like protein/PAS domain S-box-containing protein
MPRYLARREEKRVVAEQVRADVGILPSSLLLAAGTAGALVLPFLDPLDGLRGRFVLVLVGLGALVAGVLVHRPRHLWPWRWAFTGLSFSATGDIAVLLASRDGEVAGNVPIDAWLTAIGGTLLLFSMGLVVRRVRGPDPGTALDALLLAVAGWTLAWQLLVVPAGAPGWAGSGTEVAGGLQVLVYAGVLGLIIGTAHALPRGRRTSASLLAVALGAALTAFLLGAMSEAAETAAHYGGVRASFGAFAYTAVGAAALHPSIRALDQRALAPNDTFTLGRSVAVGLALLTPPAVLAIAEVRGTAVGVTTLVAAWMLSVPALLVRLRLFGQGRDEARRHAAATDHRLEALVAHTTDLLLVVDPDADLTIRYASPAARRLLGFEPRQLVGRSVRDLPCDDPAILPELLLDEAALPRRVDVPLWHADGSRRWLEATADTTTDLDGGAALVLTLSDVTERKQDELRWVEAAHRDALTGLRNRRAIELELEAAFVELSAQGTRFGVLLCDLDGFKAVNDQAGHEAGDHVLQHVGARFAGMLRGDDVIGRLGGDEFVVVSHTSSTDRELIHIAHRLLSVLEEPIEIDGIAHQVGVSIGVAVADGDDLSVGALLRRADIALYAAKSAGKGQVAASNGQAVTGG